MSLRISKEGRCRPKVEHGACAKAVVVGCWVQLDIAVIRLRRLVAKRFRPKPQALDFVLPGTGRISFSSPSHTPQGVFSSFTGQTPVCPFTRAAWRGFILFPTYGSFLNALPIGKRNPACGWTKSCSAGRNPLFVRSKFAGEARKR